MPRPRAIDPIISMTISIPSSLAIRVQTLADMLQRRGYGQRTTSRMIREILTAALPAQEAALGYAWNADLVPRGARPFPPSNPGVGTFIPLAMVPLPPGGQADPPGVQPDPPGVFNPNSSLPPPLEGPTLAEIASWGQERAIAEANQSLDGFFDRVVIHDPIHGPRPSNVP